MAPVQPGSRIVRRAMTGTELSRRTEDLNVLHDEVGDSNSKRCMRVSKHKEVWMRLVMWHLQPCSGLGRRVSQEYAVHYLRAGPI